MSWVEIAELAVATDVSMAGELEREGSLSRQRVLDLVTVTLADFPDVSEAAAAAAATAVADAIDGLAILTRTGVGGWLQDRFPDNQTLGWRSDTEHLDPELGTTLPAPPTIAAFQKVGFTTVLDAIKRGVGFGIRSADGRTTALETADTFDPVTGAVPLSLWAQIAVGIVTAHHHITGADLALLVPTGRFVLHEQRDGFHLILGERDA